jgi:hypothetical protein
VSRLLLPPFVVGIVCATVKAFLQCLSLHWRPILLSLSIQPLHGTVRHWLLLFSNRLCSSSCYFVFGLCCVACFVGDQRQNYCVRPVLCLGFNFADLCKDFECRALHFMCHSFSIADCAQHFKVFIRNARPHLHS